MIDEFEDAPKPKRSRKKASKGPATLLSFDDDAPADIAGQSVGIYYSGGESSRTKRVITFRSLTPPHFGAHCWLRGGYRTFRMDRVRRVVDRDGQVLSGEEFFDWLGYQMPEEVDSSSWANTGGANTSNWANSSGASTSSWADPRWTDTSRAGISRWAGYIEDEDKTFDPPSDRQDTPQDRPPQPILLINGKPVGTSAKTINRRSLLAIAAVLSAIVLALFGQAEAIAAILVFLAVVAQILAYVGLFVVRLCPVKSSWPRLTSFGVYSVAGIVMFIVGGIISPQIVSKMSSQKPSAPVAAAQTDTKAPAASKAPDSGLGVSYDEAAAVLKELGIPLERSDTSKGPRWLGTSGLMGGELTGQPGNLGGVFFLHGLVKDDYKAVGNAMMGMGKILMQVCPQWETRGEWLLSAMQNKGGKSQDCGGNWVVYKVEPSLGISLSVNVREDN